MCPVGRGRREVPEFACIALRRFARIAGVDVVDSGAMADPRSMPRVDLERYTRERRSGGLGVHLMEKIMDSVTFRRSARRNVCRLVKRKSS